MTIIEQMARAICVINDFNPDETTNATATPFWELYIPDATAALTALLEQSHAMCVVGDSFTNHHADDAGEIFGAMIQAALDGA